MAIKKVQIIPPNYTDIIHPETSADIVIEDTEHRFVKDSEKETWDNKQDDLGVGTPSQFLCGDKTWVAVTKSNIGLEDVDNAKQLPLSGGTLTGNLHIKQEANDKVASLVTEANGQLLDFGTNYTQAGEKREGEHGALFRIDVRDDYPLFNVMFQDASGTPETTPFSVERDGNVNIPAGKDFKIGGVGVNARINELFQSVSNGKSLIATAITDNGILTNSSDTFQKMASNISRIRNPEDKTNAPGDKYLKAGDMNAGYFGVVPANQLITGVSLASQVGISAGTSQFSDAGWLKFAWNGNVQFVAKKTFRHSISWDNINTAGCVFGTKTVVIGGLTYKVRLMRSGIKDPVANVDGDMHGSEWNRLMLPIHIEAKDKSWAYPAKVEADIPYWGIDFTNEDLHTHRSFGSGSYSWCQETYSSGRVGRGSGGVSDAFGDTPSDADAYCGWRPVLELVA